MTKKFNRGLSLVVGILFLSHTFLVAQEISTRGNSIIGVSIGVDIFSHSVSNDARIQSFDILDFKNKIVASPRIGINYLKLSKSQKNGIGAEVSVWNHSSKLRNSFQLSLDTEDIEAIELDAEDFYSSKVLLGQFNIVYECFFSEWSFAGKIGALHTIKESTDLATTFNRYYITTPNSLPRYSMLNEVLVTRRSSNPRVLTYNFSPTISLGGSYRISSKISIIANATTTVISPSDENVEGYSSFSLLLNYKI